jgi:hypothetical protein
MQLQGNFYIFKYLKYPLRCVKMPQHITGFICALHGLGPEVFSDSELSSETEYFWTIW